MLPAGSCTPSRFATRRDSSSAIQSQKSGLEDEEEATALLASASATLLLPFGKTFTPDQTRNETRSTAKQADDMSRATFFGFHSCVLEQYTVSRQDVDPGSAPHRDWAGSGSPVHGTAGMAIGITVSTEGEEEEEALDVVAAPLLANAVRAALRCDVLLLLLLLGVMFPRGVAADDTAQRCAKRG